MNARSQILDAADRRRSPNQYKMRQMHSIVDRLPQSQRCSGGIASHVNRFRVAKRRARSNNLKVIMDGALQNSTQQQKHKAQQEKKTQKYGMRNAAMSIATDHIVTVTRRAQCAVP